MFAAEDKYKFGTPDSSYVTDDVKNGATTTLWNTNCITLLVTHSLVQYKHGSATTKLERVGSQMLHNAQKLIL